MTAGPYSLSALYAHARLNLLAGEVVVGRCKSAGQHYFCEACLSWIYTKPAGLDGMANIRTPMLERASDFPPFAEFFLGESLPEARSGAPYSFEAAPPIDEFLKLADAYAEWDRRPS